MATLKCGIQEKYFFPTILAVIYPPMGEIYPGGRLGLNTIFINDMVDLKSYDPYTRHDWLVKQIRNAGIREGAAKGIAKWLDRFYG